MTKAEEYRARAKEAEEKADNAPLDAKRTWREDAQQWREMAGVAERNGL